MGFGYMAIDGGEYLRERNKWNGIQNDRLDC